MTSLAHDLLTERIRSAPLAEVIRIASEINLGPVVDAEFREVSEARFQSIGGDQVLDITTDLIWTRGNVSTEKLDWEDAKKACTKCSTGNISTWRLPTIKELLSLVDYERSSPAIDPIFECVSEYYWTSTPYKPNPSAYAWVVSFYNGHSYYVDQGSHYHVRAVRPRQ